MNFMLLEVEYILFLMEWQLTEEQRIASGAGPEVVRLSVGIECAEDLISDLDQALNKL